MTAGNGTGGETLPAGPVLAVTTSTGVIGLAVGDPVGEAVGGGGEVGGGAAGRIPTRDLELVTDRRHAEELTPRLVALLGEVGVTAGDLVGLAVDIGPGRFTGLRVGLATVRALAYAIDRPVVGLTSLEILAGQSNLSGAGGAAGPVTAVIDARRQEVFQQRFVAGRPDGPPRVGRPEDLVAEAAGVVLGDGLDRYHEIYADPIVAPSGLTLLADRHPRAVDLLTLAAGRVAVAGTDVEPLYLRDPDAKANIRTRAEAGR